MASLTHSCLYEGWVRHRRHLPVLHRFRYRLFMAYLDLDEIEDRIEEIEWNEEGFKYEPFQLIGIIQSVTTNQETMPK